MIRLLIDQKHIQKGAEGRAQIEELNDVIFGILQNPENCRNTILENNLLLSFQSSGTYSLDKIWTKDHVVFNKGQRYISENVIIDSMTLSTSSTLGSAQLYVRYEVLNEDKRTKRGIGPKNLKKVINLRIQKKVTDNSFLSCYAYTKSETDVSNGVSSENKGSDLSKDFCLELGSHSFVWDEVNGICKLNSECPDKTFFVGFDGNGKICKKIGDLIDLSTVIEDTSGNNCGNGNKIGFKVDSTTKKVRIECTPL